MCATREMPQATNAPSDSAAPATCAPRIRRDSPPPCRRWPLGLLQRFATKRPCGSSASKAAHTLPCRSRKFAVAVAAKSLAPLMDVIHQPRHLVGVGIGPYAVTQVEDVPGSIAGGIEYPIGMAPQRLGRRKQGGRIQIALHRLARPEERTHLGEVRAPVDADHVHIEIDDRRGECGALVHVV